MTRIAVDPEALAGAGRAVTGIGDEFAAALKTLSSSLGGGAPSGLDAAGVAFGMAYQKSAQALLDAGAELANAGHNVGYGVGMSATNYSRAEAASTIGGTASPTTAPEKPTKVDAPSCPSSLAGGVMPPFLWSVIETFIPDSWPDGNPDRLRAAAAAWKTFSAAIDGLAGELTGPSGIVAAQQIPEGSAMTSAMTQLSQSLSEVATEAGNLATQTSEFADDVRSAQDAIRDLCDRISPSGIFDGIKAVFSGDALDEVKKIAHDVQEILENFGRQVDGRISLMQSLITGLDDLVVSLQKDARREFTHYLGDEVGDALASAFDFESNLGEGILKAGIGTIVGIQSLDPTRFASDPEGASAAWGGVLDTLKYATLTGATMDPQGAAEHGKDMLGGILHSEDWRSDRPGLGLGGVLFEAGSAATGLGAAKTGLRGATAAADAGEAGQAARAVAGAESTAPIAGRVSEITGKLDDLSTLADDLPSGAASGSHGPALPPSLTEPSVPRVPEASRLPESPVPQNVSDSAGPRAVPDGPAPRTADSPTRTVIDDLHNPEVRQQSVSSPSAPGFGAEHAGSPIVESPRQSVVATGEGRATEAVEVPHSGSSEASQGTLDYRPSGHGPTSSAAPGFHANSEPRYSAHTLPDGQIGGSHTGHTLDDGPPSGGSHTPTDAAHHDGAPDDAVNDRHHGRTVMTDDLHHPHAGLLDDSEIVAARESPTRVTDALDEGLPSTDPLVRALVPENFDNYGGLTRAEWEARYWPSHEVDVHGNPELAWPDSDSHPEGFRSPGDRAPAVLEPGTTVDRFGPGFGRFVSPEGTPFPERGLPFQSLDDGYHRYEVAKELPVWEGPIAPAMGQSGGGLQYYLPYPVVDLLIAGYIREVI